MQEIIVSRHLKRYVLNVFIGVVTIMMSLTSSPVGAARPYSAWGENYFPNLELVTQDGEKLKFYDDLIKDKVFAISFIYTRCTDSCPLETAALRKLQKAMGDRVGRDVMFYSISIDGDRDNPAELKAYAKKFNAGPGWLFLTARPEDVVLLRKKLGLYGGGAEGQALNEHGISILMGNERAGQWIKRSPFEETKSLMRVLTSRLQGKMGQQVASVKPLDDAPATSTGEMLFRSNCEACHSLGTEEGIGPGLSGVVAQRDPVWLRRWIKEPDRMIAEQDPDALSIYQKYNNLPMPNLRLSDHDVETLFHYLMTQDKFHKPAEFPQATD
jgi:protein SCO1/2